MVPPYFTRIFAVARTTPRAVGYGLHAARGCTFGSARLHTTTSLRFAVTRSFGWVRIPLHTLTSFGWLVYLTRFGSSVYTPLNGLRIWLDLFVPARFGLSASQRYTHSLHCAHTSRTTVTAFLTHALVTFWIVAVVHTRWFAFTPRLHGCLRLQVFAPAALPRRTFCQVRAFISCACVYKTNTGWATGFHCGSVYLARGWFTFVFSSRFTLLHVRLRTRTCTVAHGLRSHAFYTVVCRVIHGLVTLVHLSSLPFYGYAPRTVSPSVGSLGYVAVQLPHVPATLFTHCRRVVPHRTRLHLCVTHSLWFWFVYCTPLVCVYTTFCVQFCLSAVHKGLVLLLVRLHGTQARIRTIISSRQRLLACVCG